MKQTNRRVFVIRVAAAGSGLLALQATAQTAATRPQSAASQPQVPASRPQAAAAGAAGTASTAGAAPKVDEKDPQAAAMAYAQDTTKVDNKKFPKHSAEQKCNNCQLYTGKPTDASAPCPLFPGKHVLANAWCSAYVKKA